MFIQGLETHFLEPKRSLMSFKLILKLSRVKQIAGEFLVFFAQDTKHSKKIPPIAEPKCDPGDYELVIIGTPIWAGRMSSPVRAYLLRFHGCFGKVAFFATSALGGHEKVFDEMAEIAGKPLAILEITMKQIKNGKVAEGLKGFL
ncbi:MAG TPA: hypothetical protein DIT29_06260 [Pseudothermotoga sp.]|nr:hypothetical protein [Pseudothermotoga sp.]